MSKRRFFTAIIQREGKQHVALCPELDIASQGRTREQAQRNLTEAVELFLVAASPSEIKRRLHEPAYVIQLEVKIG